MDRLRTIWVGPGYTGDHRAGIDILPSTLPGYILVTLRQDDVSIPVACRVGEFITQVQEVADGTAEHEHPEPDDPATPDSARTFDLNRDIFVTLALDPGNPGHLFMSVVQNRLDGEGVNSTTFGNISPTVLVDLATAAANTELWGA